MRKVKNNKATLDSWTGQEIEPGVYYTIETIELGRWQNDSKVLTDIAVGNLIMNDGTVDILDVAKAINFLKDADPTPRDSDGAAMQRAKITTSGWGFQYHHIEFKTAQLDSYFSQRYDGEQHGFGTLKCYKDNGAGGVVLCTDQADADANAIVTQVDWEPTHDFEIIGGELRQLLVPAVNVRLWTVGVPDVPEAGGGTRVFATSVNLKFLAPGESIKVDGRAPKYLTYNATYHSNKLRLFFRHPAGFKHDLSMAFELFKE